MLIFARPAWRRPVTRNKNANCSKKKPRLEIFFRVENIRLLVGVCGRVYQREGVVKGRDLGTIAEETLGGGGGQNEREARTREEPEI